MSDLPNTFKTIRDHARITPASVLLVIFQISTIVFFSLTVPFLIRHLLSVPFVELNEPLEFTFHTCTDQLHGVCSFPEAEVIFDEVIFITFIIFTSLFFSETLYLKVVIDTNSH